MIALLVQLHADVRVLIVVHQLLLHLVELLVEGEQLRALVHHELVDARLVHFLVFLYHVQDVIDLLILELFFLFLKEGVLLLLVV